MKRITFLKNISFCNITFVIQKMIELIIFCEVNRMNTNTYYKPLVYWLYIGAFMVVVMVIIGGITRLTDSGLSMVDWKLFHGTIPPMNEIEWQETFNNYKNYPEYKMVNFNMTLSEFKSIFFWEWFHRVWGRLIGMVFLLPFISFLLLKKVSRVLSIRLVGLLILGGFQGFLGWYMVKSGLNTKPDVSHYRLAIHLITAFGTFGYIIWLIFNITGMPAMNINSDEKWIRRLLYILIPMIIVQIVYGAFVAGLRAGAVYNTWPMMGDFWIPPQISAAIADNGFVALLDEMVSVQFVHRIIAYFIFGLVFYIWYRSRNGITNGILKKAINLVWYAVVIQVILGILTLLMRVPLILGLLHQVGALLLLGTVVYLMFQCRYKLAKYSPFYNK